MEILATAAKLVSGALSPLAKTLAGSDDQLKRYFRTLGWILPTVPQVLKDLQSTSNQLMASSASFEEKQRQTTASSDSDGLLDETTAKFLLDLSLFTKAISDLSPGLRDQLPSQFVSATQIDSEIQNRILHDALSRYVESDFRNLYLVGRLLGLLEAIPHAADPAHFQPAYEERLIRFDRLPQLVSDPATVMREVYGWGTPTLDGDKLFLILRDLSFALLAPVYFTYAARSLLRAIVPELAEGIVGERGLRMSFFEDSPLQMFVSLFPFPNQQPDEQQGLMLTLSGLASMQETLPITPLLSLSFKSQIDLTSGIALAFWPDRSPKIVGNIANAATSLIEGARATLGAKYALSEGDKRLQLLSVAGFQVDAKAISAEAGIGLANGTADASIIGTLTGLRVRMTGLGGDSFLADTVPDKIALEFDLSLGWSLSKGLQLQGSFDPTIVIPIGETIGPIRVDALELSFPSTGDKYQVGVGGVFSAQIGPVSAQVEGLGFAMTLDTQGGNLGPIDLGFSVMLPKGVGLAVDAAGVSGGGFLKHDDTKHEYSGMLQLKFTNLALQAFGIITTELPTGPGYALLGLIDANFPPIQLGWGFMLDGLGGAAGVNRTASVEALHAGIKADALSSVLFPTNPIANGPQILAQLDTLFPVAPGRFLFGPMAEITWGKPTMLKAALAVIIELPEPIRIILLGRITARIPSEDKALVRLTLDSLGVLDLSQDSVSLDATLFDSHILDYPLSGDMALRANWSGQRTFLMSVGGFHPKFTPPDGFPTLKRMTLDMASGIVTTLHLESYLAITSNTLQFGANLHVVIGVSAFSIDGHLGFDALFQRHPFHFEADISGSVAVSIDGEDLLSVSLDGSLSGGLTLACGGRL